MGIILISFLVEVLARPLFVIIDLGRDDTIPFLGTKVETAMVFATIYVRHDTECMKKGRITTVITDGRTPLINHVNLTVGRRPRQSGNGSSHAP